jgi:hypothetical protein
VREREIEKIEREREVVRERQAARGRKRHA